MIKKDLYNMRYAILALMVYGIFMQTQFHTICPFKALTGLPCPACGLTHATIYLLMGDFSKAFSANPTVLLWLITLLLFGFDRYIHSLKIKIFPYFFSLVGIITIIWYCFSIL